MSDFTSGPVALTSGPQAFALIGAEWRYGWYIHVPRHRRLRLKAERAGGQR